MESPHGLETNVSAQHCVKVKQSSLSFCLEAKDDAVAGLQPLKVESVAKVIPQEA
jgi:hypothetical protein